MHSSLFPSSVAGATASTAATAATAAAAAAAERECLYKEILEVTVACPGAEMEFLGWRVEVAGRSRGSRSRVEVAG